MSKIIPAAEAKTNFGALLDAAQKEPTTISKNGRPVAVVMSIDEFEQHQALKLERLRQEIEIGMDQLKRGETVDGAEAFAELESEFED